jgi:hypothetical protein
MRLGSAECQLRGSVSHRPASLAYSESAIPQSSHSNSSRQDTDTLNSCNEQCGSRQQQAGPQGLPQQRGDLLFNKTLTASSP